MKRLNRFFYLLLLSAAFAACSDDDGPKTPPVEYDVISFEPAEGMLDFKGNAAAPRPKDVRTYRDDIEHIQAGASEGVKRLTELLTQN